MARPRCRSSNLTRRGLFIGRATRTCGVRSSAKSATDEPLIPEGALYATARQLSRRYQVSVKWISARSALLGATPISDSPNSELRYHLPTADSYMETRRRATPVSKARRRRTSATRETTRNGAPLLPFKRP
jgi:hypothetical protein